MSKENQTMDKSGELSEAIYHVIRAIVAEVAAEKVIEILGAMNYKPKGEARKDAPGEMGDALAVARIMGLDLSSEAARKSARQRVYYLASIKSIPATRLSKKRLSFDLDKIRKLLAGGGDTINS